ncbi:hypothetical protein N656DRAFT_795062 [Canariomyces notabilis]|uniref:Uncharacterized protein n=1 Tax=Canariomyces notabilis TaxID=2074819 RepID=A0AAN6YX55_9PEZI|nr:hypothetical protein N656DRAFT_795062 [Canariomyces arenarius]
MDKLRFLKKEIKTLGDKYTKLEKSINAAKSVASMPVSASPQPIIPALVAGSRTGAANGVATPPTGPKRKYDSDEQPGTSAKRLMGGSSTIATPSGHRDKNRRIGDPVIKPEPKPNAYLGSLAGEMRKW